MTTPALQLTLTAEKTVLGTGVTALVLLKVRNVGPSTNSVVIACPINTDPGNESSRAWSSPAVPGVSGNDASGTGSISDTVSIAAGKEVTYVIVCTLAVLGAYNHAVSTIKATAAVSSVVYDRKHIRLYQGDMTKVTFNEGLEPNAVQLAEMFFNPVNRPELVDWMENAGGHTLWDLT